MHGLILPSTRADFSSHCHPGLCRAPRIISLFCWYLLSRSIHHNPIIMWWKMNRQWLVRNIHPTSSTSMKNTKYSIHYLASSYISSSMVVTPVSPRGISASVSLLDSEWQNMRVSIVLESILSSKGQFASSKLNINRVTWETHRFAVMI